jgi:Ca-activated chloride channel family protein
MGRTQKNPPNNAIALLVLAALSLCCVLTVLPFLVRLVSPAVSTVSQTTDTRDPRTARLTVAISPEKRALVNALVEEFNAQELRTDDRQAIEITLMEMTPEEMVDQALSGQAAFQAMSPDSSVWLDQLNRRWAEAQVGSEPGTIPPRLAGDAVRYAVTPIVIAAWEDVARSLGWPDRPVRWTDLQDRARSDKDFKWSHPSTAHASGLLATLAEFYAGAGVQRGLTPELVQDPKTLEFVSAIEKTVRYYGEAEHAVIERAAKEGSGYLDAFVLSEQLVAAFNGGEYGEPPGKLVALYPAEGTLWADHPLALLETPGLTANQRRTFQAFREFLAQPGVQEEVLRFGYRPADLSVALDGPNSPLTAARGVNPAEPQTTLQLPAPDVVAAVQNAWALTKRRANILLVADTSGSMEGEKLANAQAALRVFLSQIPSDQERVGLVEFNSGIANIRELAPLSESRPVLTADVEALQAGGNTALLDAVYTAYTRLQRESDPERINAIVVMTDGRENASAISTDQLLAAIRQGNRDNRVIVFAVAYGDDADYDLLDELAAASGGQVREGTPETIQDLYKILSSYF